MTDNASGVSDEEFGGAIIAADVTTALLSAMVNTLPITREEIGPNTKPSKPPISADEGAWNRTLLTFEAKLHATDGRYRAYRHQRRYANDTLNLAVPAISDYLRGKVEAALAGGSNR